MKRNKLIGMMMAACLITGFGEAKASSFEGVCAEQSGKLNCGNGRLDQLNYMGDVIMNGTTITGATRILGDLEMHNAHVNRLRLIGDLKATDSVVTGETTITGDTTLSNVSFGGTTKIVGNTVGNNIVFQSSTHIIGDIDIKDMIIKSDLTLAAYKASVSHSNISTIHFDTSDKTQNLYLKGNSIVNGDIDFPSGRGTVYLSSDSRLNGKVTGGKVVNNS